MNTETSEATTPPEKHGQGLRAVIEARQHELEQRLSEIGKDAAGGKGSDVEAALSTLKTLLPANLDQISPMNAQELSHWLNTNKYVGQPPSTQDANGSAGRRWEKFAGANIKFALPAMWNHMEKENERVVVVHSVTSGIGLEFVAFTSPEQAGVEEKMLMDELSKMLTDPKPTHPPQVIRQHGLDGQTVRGTATKDGRPVEWFSICLQNAQGRGVLAVGYGDADQPSAEREALTEILNSIQLAD